MLQILAATSNKHKVEEFKAAFAPLLSKMTILTADEIMPTCPLLPMTPVWKSRF